jgi:hypothetical protein
MVILDQFVVTAAQYINLTNINSCDVFVLPNTVPLFYDRHNYTAIPRSFESAVANLNVVVFSVHCLGQLSVIGMPLK